MADFDQELDASGLNCPLPILRAKKTLTPMESGQVLHIIATDPGSVKDFEAFSKQTGNELMESREEGGKFHFLIKKARILIWNRPSKTPSWRRFRCKRKN